jgi:hypothetical protein
VMEIGSSGNRTGLESPILCLNWPLTQCGCFLTKTLAHLGGTIGHLLDHPACLVVSFLFCLLLLFIKL